MNMKVSKRDIGILLFVFGAIVAFCVYQFYFRGAMDKKKTYEEDSKTLQDRLNKYLNVDENAVIAEMAKNSEDLSEKAKRYPAAYRYEDIIMYLDKWQSLPYEEMYYFKTYTIEETTVSNVIGGVIDWDQTNRMPIETSYMFSKATLKTTYGTNTYKGFKDMINKIYLHPAPKTIHTLQAVFDASTGFVAGSIDVDFFNVHNGTNVYEPVDIGDVKTGVENIFGPTYTPTPTPTPTLTPDAENENNGRTRR